MTEVRTDAALWAAMASGDVGAWGELFDRHACQKRLRSDARRQRRVEEASVVSPPGDIAEAVAQTDLLDRRRAWLRHQVANLPVQFRDVVELVVYAEMPYADAARVLGIPLGTVKSRMTRARHLIEVQAEAAADGLDPAERALPR